MLDDPSGGSAEGPGVVGTSKWGAPVMPICTVSHAWDSPWRLSKCDVINRQWKSGHADSRTRKEKGRGEEGLKQE